MVVDIGNDEKSSNTRETKSGRLRNELTDLEQPIHVVAFGTGRSLNRNVILKANAGSARP